MHLVIEILAYLCECIAILLSVNAFLGRKIKWDYKTIIFVIIDIIVLLLILHYKLPSVCSMATKVILIGYVWWEFKLDLEKSILLMIFNVLLMVAIQALVMLPVCIIAEKMNQDTIIAFLINFLSMIILYLLTKWIRLNAVYLKIIKRGQVIVRILLLCAVIIIYLMIRYKISEKMVVFAYFISAIMVCILLSTIFIWQKDRYIMKQKSMELKMHELYGKAFEGMIENIRIRQHDFKNQLAAIYGMRLTVDTFEELVESQKKYCDYLMKESRFDQILTKCNDKILAGFLYTKFTEVEQKEIQVSFEIRISNSKHSLATYGLIEIIGILIDNAVEYELEYKKGNKIQFKIVDDGENIEITCSNTADYMSMEEIRRMFQKGYSTKGENRGIGLYNVKKILEGRGDIIVSNNIEQGENRIEFCIKI